MGKTGIVNGGEIDAGTLVRSPSNCPGSTCTSKSDQSLFESAIQSLEAEAANIGTHLNLDSATRFEYAKRIRALAAELRDQAQSGRITWSQAASQAQDARNVTMELIRGRSTPVGRAMAESIKQEGKTLNELIALQTEKIFGAGADFNRLTEAERNTVYAQIVKSAGKSNARVNAIMRRLSKAGRGLLVLSIALSVYQIATADDKVDAAKKEAAVTGAGIAGGIAGGAIAGLACGPGAPVCVAVGAFVGGAVAAFGVDWTW